MVVGQILLYPVGWRLGSSVDSKRASTEMSIALDDAAGPALVSHRQVTGRVVLVGLNGLSVCAKRTTRPAQASSQRCRPSDDLDRHPFYHHRDDVGRSTASFELDSSPISAVGRPQRRP